ncbi:hypothetical protein [Archaeoglobus sp.]
MEKPYFCALCGRNHRPYIGLIYTQHLPWKSSEKALKEAREIWLEIIDNFERYLPEMEIVTTRDLGVAIASLFHKGNFPVELNENRATITFGRLRVVIKFVASAGSGNWS